MLWKHLCQHFLFVLKYVFIEISNLLSQIGYLFMNLMDITLRAPPPVTRLPVHWRRPVRCKATACGILVCIGCLHLKNMKGRWALPFTFLKMLLLIRITLFRTFEKLNVHHVLGFCKLSWALHGAWELRPLFFNSRRKNKVFLFIEIMLFSMRENMMHLISFHGPKHTRSTYEPFSD